ncbi:MAG: hypothetical protein JWO38_7192 [Gemmataceae bacterium]|nr:hypothetical protein [Gemmataceae bacterium]
MPPVILTCPRCRTSVSRELGAADPRPVCPSCGAALSPSLDQAGPAPGDESDDLVMAEPFADEEENPRGEADPPAGDPPTEGGEKKRAKRKARTPVWQWTLFGVVLLAAGGLVAGMALLQDRTGATTAGTASVGPSVQEKPGDTIPLTTVQEPVKVPGPLAPVPPELADVIYLLPDDTDPKLQTYPNIFKRELIRQGLWLAAREDFGLRVKDAVLGDSAPAGLPGHRQFRFRDFGEAVLPWRLTVGEPGAEHQVWKGEFPRLAVSPPPHRRSVEAAEEISRGMTRKWLEAGGHAARPVRLSDAPVPAAAETHLHRMRETDQFAALRLIHAEVRAKGESPALLTALARGYANLGLLTEFHWGAAPTAFKARAVLYAQRLLARDPQSPVGLRARGYAAALVGLHKLAEDDFAAAAKLAAAPPPPDWAEAADAYVHFDLSRLAAVRAKADTDLVRLLQYLAVEDPKTPVVTLNAGRAYLATNPECYRVHHALADTGGVSSQHTTTRVGGEVLSENLSARLAEMPGLPRAVAAALGDANEADVYAALRAEGAPKPDNGEPSWAALGSLLQEIRFTQALQRLYFLEWMLGASAADTANELLPPLRGHPLRGLIETFKSDPRTAPGRTLGVLQSISIPDVPAHKAKLYLWLLEKTARNASVPKVIRANSHVTWLYADLLGQIEINREDVSKRWTLGKELCALSPNAPYALAALVGQPEPEVVARLPEIERTHADFAVVQRALGERHLADKRYVDAVRCWQRSLKLSPDGATYRKLGAAYLAAGQEEAWRETLEASLEHEDTGLEHAQTRTILAEHYMAKKDFKRAEPYALAAAGSGAAFGLLVAARCEQGLRQWGRAEDLYRSAAGYGGPALDWYFATRLTGKMNRADAERAARSFLAPHRPVHDSQAFAAGRFHLLTGDRVKAREFFDAAKHIEPNDLTSLFAALSADEAGDRAGRDQFLRERPTLPPGKEYTLADVIRMFQGFYARAIPPDAAAIEKAVDRLPAEVRPDAELFVGWYLSNRGLKDRAVEHWKRCAGAEAGRPLLKTHARGFLEARAAAEPDGE